MQYANYFIFVIFRCVNPRLFSYPFSAVTCFKGNSAGLSVSRAGDKSWCHHFLLTRQGVVYLLANIFKQRLSPSRFDVPVSFSHCFFLLRVDGSFQFRHVFVRFREWRFFSAVQQAPCRTTAPMTINIGRGEP